MKIETLIAHLQNSVSIRGKNADVLLWNGMVGDWMDINLVSGDLVKMTEKSYLEANLHERMRDEKNWEYEFSSEELADLRKMYRKVCKWETNQFVTEEDIKAGRYKRKQVLYVDGKPRGVSTFDRLGSIEY